MKYLLALMVILATPALALERSPQDRGHVAPDGSRHEAARSNHKGDSLSDRQSRDLFNRDRKAYQRASERPNHSPLRRGENQDRGGMRDHRG